MLYDKTVYQKYIKTPARVDYAPPVLTRAQVQGLEESRLIIRGHKDQGLVSSEKVWTSPVIYGSPNTLFGRVQFFRKDLYKAVEGQRKTPVVLSMIT